MTPKNIKAACLTTFCSCRWMQCLDLGMQYAACSGYCHAWRWSLHYRWQDGDKRPVLLPVVHLVGLLLSQYFAPAQGSILHLRVHLLKPRYARPPR